MWDRLTDIAEQARPQGREYSPDLWHEIIKRLNLPETCAKGIDKWGELPNGDRVLVMSTTDLDVSEMTDYLDKLAATAGEYGVELRA